VEHPLQLEASHLAFEFLRIGIDIARGALVAFAFRELEQLCGIRDALRGAVELAGFGSQPDPLTA
jgi:hypothetical protein